VNKVLTGGLSVLILSLISACTTSTAGNDGAATAGPSPISIAAHADSIYHGGSVITVDDQESIAEAIAVKNGKILAVGSEQELLARHQGQSTRMISLDGATLLPGFIDAHGHFMQVGLAAQSANLLPPPDGVVNSIESLKKALSDHAGSTQAKQLGWIVGNGYDDAQLAEQRHPTAAELDEISTDMPVFAMHQSGHLGALNSVGLKAMGYDENSKDMAGGKIRRKPGSNEPNGVLEEFAYFGAAMALISKITPDMIPSQVASAQKAYVEAGFTTAQEGRAQESDLTAMMAMADAGALDIDVTIYPDPTLATDPDALWAKVKAQASNDYSNRVRVAGIKLSLDGSPQGKTAWFKQPYFVPPEGADKDYAGYPQLKDELLQKWIDLAFDNDVQVLTHLNGDAAIDQLLIAVYVYTKQSGPADRRPVAIHAQTTREDQLDRMKDLGIIPSFMTVHTFYWGDWHRDSVLGPERAARISPQKSALDRGMMFTSHNDAPVTLPNSQMILYSQVNRLTRSEQILGPDQRVGAMDAIRAITRNAAFQLFEEDRKGTLEVGKLADFVILDRNPLTIAPTELLNLKVLQTIKEGKAVYRADEE
jgi:predicted amidohydrolase YtcJ